ncbi:hypothetical protein [Shinella zoogloeoides]|uniref:hypothetical protein n=1 Tax=Shinella zoogloeoides TaxID=352475 RepID=UPI00299D7D1D|nr:hypothetical protein [Shinella zoogloeoides]WPE22447.1 hypothetical protein ShzoTeo12_36630 [Shinella zoogloeoides]
MNHDIIAVLAALKDITAALPEDRVMAFEAMTFAIIEVAVSENIAAEDIHANIDKVLRARQAAAKEVLS